MRVAVGLVALVAAFGQAPAYTPLPDQVKRVSPSPRQDSTPTPAPTVAPMAAPAPAPMPAAVPTVSPPPSAAAHPRR
jgi:chitinase